MKKPTILIPTRSDTNLAVQSQKMVRGWKFWIKKVAELYYPCSENKCAYLICAFVFAYADCWFSHAAAQITSHLQIMVQIFDIIIKDDITMKLFIFLKK